MLFGSKESFAIECEDSVSESPALQTFGSICFWIGGERVGDYDSFTSLGFHYLDLRDFLEYVDTRRDPVLDAMDPGQIMRHLYWALYDNSRDSIEEDLALASRFRKFILWPNGSEAFDYWMIALLDRPDEELLIWARHGNYDAPNQAHLKSGTFESVVRGFLLWYDGRFPESC